MELIVVEESLYRTPEQAKIYFSDKLRQYLREHNIDFKIFDKDVTNGEGRCPEKLNKILKSAEDYIPAIFVFHDGTLHHFGKLPDSVNQLINTLDEIYHDIHKNE